MWVSRGVHPNWRGQLQTFAAGTGHELVDVDLTDGVSAWPSEGEPGAILLHASDIAGASGLEPASLERALAAPVSAEGDGALIRSSDADVLRAAGG